MRVQSSLYKKSAKSRSLQLPLNKPYQHVSYNYPITVQTTHISLSFIIHFNGQIYKQTDGTSMGSYLSPAIANLFIEYLETEVLQDTSLKLSYENAT